MPRECDHVNEVVIVWDGWVEGLVARWMDELVGWWVDGWVNSWMDEWVGG